MTKRTGWFGRVWRVAGVCLLGSCGGGGGADAPPPVPAPVEAAPVPEAAGEDEASPLTLPDGDAVAEASVDAEGDGTADPAEFALEAYAPAQIETQDKAAAGQATRATLYVSPKGKDSNPGSAVAPFRSLARAARAARAGTLVLVAPGSYAGGLRSTASGAPNARITFLSTRKWGAVIVPPRNSPNKTAWDNRGDHVDIFGFEIDGRVHQGGVRWTHGIYNGGSYDVIRNNHVHHIAQGSACTRAGGAAIGVDGYYRGVSAEVLGNLVHDIGPTGCRFVQGIYVSTSARVLNNVVYRVAEGAIHLWHDARNVVIANNTVTASNTGLIIGGGNFYHTKGPNDHTAVYNNIVYDNKMGVSEQGKTGRNNVYGNNLVYQNSRYNWGLQNGLSHSATVVGPPQFLAGARSAAPNLRIAPSSPAVGMGTPLHATDSDFDGRPRNAKAGYDIGAYQH